MNADYHTHTFFSSDSSTSMEEMVQSAIDKKIKYYAITDHYDPGYVDTNFPFTLDFPGYWNELNHMSSKYEDQITIAKGLEIGIMEGQLDEARRAILEYDFDFVIGSFHCYGGKDLYEVDFDSIADKKKYTMDFYEYMYKCLKKYDEFDVLGHFTILDRYIGEVMDHDLFLDLSREMLKLVIFKDKGIELNTSNFRYNMDMWMPREIILKEYLALGGKILTIGSDAHAPKHQQDHFDEAVLYLKSLGFTNYCTYEKRNPTFHSL